jgi:hypothetical protein
MTAFAELDAQNPLHLVSTVFPDGTKSFRPGSGRTGLDMNIARAEADATATTVIPEDCSVFCDRTDIQYCVRGNGNNRSRFSLSAVPRGGKSSKSPKE